MATSMLTPKYLMALNLIQNASITASLKFYLVALCSSDPSAQRNYCSTFQYLQGCNKIPAVPQTTA